MKKANILLPSIDFLHIFKKAVPVMVSHVTNLNKFEYFLHLKVLLIHNQNANGLGAPPQQVDRKVVPAYEQFANLHSEKLLHALTVMNHIDIDFACMYNKLQDLVKKAFLISSCTRFNGWRAQCICVTSKLLLGFCKHLQVP